MTRSTRNRTARTRRHAYRPTLDALEGRTLLSTIQVTSTLDRPFAADSVLTLRDAILLVDGNLTAGQLSAAQQALVTGTPDQTGVTDTIDFNIPFNDPGHVYYKRRWEPGISGAPRASSTSRPWPSTASRRSPQMVNWTTRMSWARGTRSTRTGRIAGGRFKRPTRCRLNSRRNDRRLQPGGLQPQHARRRGQRGSEDRAGWRAPSADYPSLATPPA